MDVFIPILIPVVTLTLALLLMRRRGGGSTPDLASHIQRLTSDAAPAPDIDITRTTAPPKQFLDHFLLQFGVIRRLQSMIVQAGLFLSPSKFVLIMLLLMGMGAAFGKVFGGTLLTLPSGLILACLPLVYLRICRRRRTAAFGQQLPEVLDLLKSSLQAGHSLLRGLQVVSEEFADPASSEFRLLLEQARLGIPVPAAFEAMFQRVPEESLRFLLVAIKVQQDVGSSLAEILGRLAETVRSRQRIKLKIKTLTAQPRMSGWVVGCLPVVMIGYYAIAQPFYFHMLLYNPLGQMILKVGAGLDLMGILLIRRIVRLDY